MAALVPLLLVGCGNDEEDLSFMENDDSASIDLDAVEDTSRPDAAVDESGDNVSDLDALGEGDDTSPLVGRYEVVLEPGSEKAYAILVEEGKAEGSLVFADDGTYVFKIFGAEASGKYRLVGDEVVLAPEEVFDMDGKLPEVSTTNMKFDAEEGTLTFVDDLVFARVEQ
jgi:hypothetical protein